MYSTEDQRWEDNNQNLKRYIQSEEVERQLMQLVHQGKSRLPIKLNNIRAQNEDLASDIIHNPQKAIRIIQPEIQEKLKNMDLGDTSSDKKGQIRFPNFQVSFEGDLGKNLITPRGLSCQLSNQLVGVQGLVTRLSTSKCKLLKSVHYCQPTDKGHVKEYENTLDLAATPNYNATKTIPSKDTDGNPITMEDGKSTFINTQSFSLQELPETAPPGLLPRQIEVVIENDLVDTIRPGDRIQVTGVFKTLATQRTLNAGIFKTVLVATNCSPITEDKDLNDLTADDIKQIKEQSKKTDLLAKMVNSVAPSIQGHDFIKQGILLQLLGGQEKNVNGVHLRGDINIMMIGDPSTAKSQMLRYVMGVAPLAINTTGRGSSGVGLTAVVKFDKQTGQRTLEAGAMVLADRGIVCIDELDKMDEIDRVAIHEAMEQQTVTISKAGINCSLNARCSVIAAANPIYGEYHTDLPPTKNINLPDSLLSRFDLLFIVLDEKEQEKDRKVAERVTRNHMYRSIHDKDRLQTREMMDLEDQDHVIQPQIQDEKTSRGIYQKANNVYNDKSKGQIYSQDFLSKYLKYAKKSCQPQLTQEAIDYLAKKWKDLRAKDLDNTEVKVLPVTVRTYESLIRLSTAFAKLRLKRKVDSDDCKLGYQLLKKSLFGSDDLDSDSDNDDDDGMEVEQQKSKQTKKKPQQRKQSTGASASKQQGFKKFDKDSKQSQQQQQQQQQQRVTRQSQQQQQQSQQQKQGKNKTQDISQQMQKIKITDDDEQEADAVLAEQKLASIQVTKQERANVFKAASQLADQNNEGFTTLTDLWNKVKSAFGQNHKAKVIKCLTELDQDGKLDYNPDEETIYTI